MKKVYILTYVFISFLFSCSKQKMTMEGGIANCVLQNPPSWCATVRCSADGKPVCGCNNVNYGSVCEAQCAGVTSYTVGTCR